MEAKEILKELAIYKPGLREDEVKKKYNLEKIVKLSSNENPYGYSPLIDKETPNLFKDLEIYPDGHASKIRTALAHTYALNEDQIIFGTGTDEIINLICRAYLEPHTHTIVPTPSFPQYQHHAKIEGAEVTEVALKNGKHDLETMYQSIKDNTKVIWLCTPNNPTGGIIPKDDIYRFVEKCPEDILIVLDEAYIEFVEEDLRPDFFNKLQDINNIILLRTFSKAYGLASLRIGYGMAHVDIIHNLNVVRGPFNTTTLSQEIACIALNDQEFIQNTFNNNRKVRDLFQAFLDDLGWPYQTSHTNFIFIKTPINANIIAGKLMEHGFIIRPMGEDYIRITLGLEEDMNELQDVLKKINEEI